jgi:uncharacterized lipoprotein YbaY
MTMKEGLMLFIVAALLVVGFITGCNKDQGQGPGPGPKVTTFSAGTANLQIQGEVLPGSKVTADEAKAAVNLAVEMLENPKP